MACSFVLLLVIVLIKGGDPEVFERGGPEVIIYKVLERGGPKSLKMAFECSFQSFSYKSSANSPPKWGPRAPPLNPPLDKLSHGFDTAWL